MSDTTKQQQQQQTLIIFGDDENGKSANVNANAKKETLLKSRSGPVINVRYTISPTTESETLVSTNDFKTSMGIKNYAKNTVVGLIKNRARIDCLGLNISQLRKLRSVCHTM